MNANDLIGVSLELRKFLSQQQGAMAGDLVFAASPATVGATATTGGFTRTVTVSLLNAAGEVQSWFNKAFTAGVAVSDTSTLATATIPSTTLTFVNGKASVVVTGSVNTWAAAETDTVTVAAQTVMGYSLATVTSVQTFA